MDFFAIDLPVFASLFYLACWDGWEALRATWYRVPACVGLPSAE
jgi:hypothetical protein